MAVKQPISLSDELLAGLPTSPDIYLQKIDLVRESGLLVRFDAAAYRAASFLDDRILGPGVPGAWLPLDRVELAARHVPGGRGPHFIFHTGHVGSTLVSRLLDETGEVHSLREPLPLRTLADAHDVLGQPESLLSESQFTQALGLCVRLWRRAYVPTQSVVLKATSSAGRMAVTLLSSCEGARAIYMNLRAEPYLAALLAGQNSPIDLRGHGQERMRRLRSRVTAPVAPLHMLALGEMAAMSWLAETWAQDDAVAEQPDKVITLDFDRFLESVEFGMSRILAHFGLSHDARQLSMLARSPVLAHYSKAPEFAFTPAGRAEILDRSRHANRVQIRDGMQWLERLARSDAAVAAVVNRAELRGH